MATPLRELRPFDPRSALARARVLAGAERTGARLSLRFVVEELPPTVRVPVASGAPARRDRLWEHTCLEVFAGPAGVACYWEVNLSPAGDWNVYRFDGYRQGMRPDARVGAPAVFAASAATTDTGGTLTLAATLDLAPLPELASGALDVALAAILESSDGELCWYALRHTTSRPDFHARDGFLVRLDGGGA